jgi:phasin family protein
MNQNLNLEQLAAAQKANAEVMTTLMRSALEGVQKLAEMNMAATRDFFNATVANTSTLMAAKDPNEVAQLQQSLARPNMEKMMSYSRGVYELMADMQKQVASVVESQVSQFSKTASTAIDKTKGSAPVGGDVFAAAMKSMLDASNKAYENMNAMAKQMADIAEANMSAASSATAKAVGAATKSAAKK